MRRRKITVQNRYLLIPVAADDRWRVPDETLQYLGIYEGDTLLQEYEVVLGRKPRFWSPVYLEQYQGKELELRLENGDETLLELLELSNELKDAETLYRESGRPQVHFTPRHGFMNDPNGLYYDGEAYHYFAQLNPFGLSVGNTHWLHAVSSDLIHWRELPYALLPDESGRMYSGSAVVDADNSSGLGRGDVPPVFLFYTAAGSKSRLGRGRPFEIAAAISRDGGRTYEKYQMNPVVPYLVFYNRDPKVVRHEDGYWIMMIFLDNSRYLLLYSENLLQWERGQIIEIEGSAECPDLFRLPLDEDESMQKWVLWGSTDNYIVGRIRDREFYPETNVIRGPSHTAVSAYSDALRPSGSYAAQTYFGLPGGRVVQQAWIRARIPGVPFVSCASLPNELKLVSTEDGPRLSLLPAKEVEIMREKGYILRHRGLEDLERIPGEYLAECMDITFGFDCVGTDLIAVSVRGILMVYDPGKRQLFLPNGCFQIPGAQDSLGLRVITDRGSVEIYTGDGLFHTVLATVPDPNNIGVKILALHPSVSVNLELYPLKSIWHADSFGQT